MPTCVSPESEDVETVARCQEMERAERDRGDDRTGPEAAPIGDRAEQETSEDELLQDGRRDHREDREAHEPPPREVGADLRGKLTGRSVRTAQDEDDAGGHDRRCDANHDAEACPHGELARRHATDSGQPMISDPSPGCAVRSHRMSTAIVTVFDTMPMKSASPPIGPWLRARG